MKYQKIYEEFKKKYTDDEIVDSMLLPANLTKKEKEKLSAEMKCIYRPYCATHTGPYCATHTGAYCATHTGPYCATQKELISDVKVSKIIVC